MFTDKDLQLKVQDHLRLEKEYPPYNEVESFTLKALVGDLPEEVDIKIRDASSLRSLWQNWLPWKCHIRSKIPYFGAFVANNSKNEIDVAFGATFCFINLRWLCTIATEIDRLFALSIRQTKSKTKVSVCAPKLHVE